jgi:hypothetical protein
VTKEQKREYNKKYRATYNRVEKDKIAAAGRKYYAENKEELLAASKLYHEQNKEKVHETHREFYKNNRQAIIDYNKDYYLDNKEYIKQRNALDATRIAGVQKAYQTSHAEEIKKWSQEYGRRPDRIFKIYQWSAKRRGISFDLTYEQFLTFWQKSCFYCKHGIETIGLDRINNDAGYEMTNVVPCCKVCNRMKADMSQDEFRAHVRSIAF